MVESKEETTVDKSVLVKLTYNLSHGNFWRAICKKYPIVRATRQGDRLYLPIEVENEYYRLCGMRINIVKSLVPSEYEILEPIDLIKLRLKNEQKV